jgi:hypothetical protein
MVNKLIDFVLIVVFGIMFAIFALVAGVFNLFFDLPYMDDDNIV